MDLNLEENTVVAIIGGGHMGKKMYDFVYGSCDVVIVDTPVTGGIHTKWWGMLNSLHSVGSRLRVYIATPEFGHIHWLSYLPDGVDVLVEKPFILPTHSIEPVVRSLRNRRVWFTCHLPWRFYYKGMKLCKLENPGIFWSRSTDFMYREQTVPICIDIGPHMFDLMGSSLGRDVDHFDRIIYNSSNRFEAVYKGKKVSMVIEKDAVNVCVVFDDVLTSVIPDQYMLDVFKRWLIDEWEQLPSPDEIIWVHNLLTRVWDDFNERCGGKVLWKDLLQQ